MLEKIMKLSIILLSMLVYSTVFAQATHQIDPMTSEASTQRPDAGKTPTPQEDAIITDSIKSHIKNSAVLSKLNVDVRTNQGIVTLSGNVDSDSQASMLIELAQSIIGVKDVDAGNLTVKSSDQPFTDMMITAKIKGLFLREKVFGDKDIAAINLSVETKNGIVYLTGIIDNQEQINNAIKLIEGVRGVKKVEFHVKKVTPTSATNNVPDSTTNTSTTSPASTTTPVTSTNTTTTTSN